MHLFLGIETTITQFLEIALIWVMPAITIIIIKAEISLTQR